MHKSNPIHQLFIVLSCCYTVRVPSPPPPRTPTTCPVFGSLQLETPGWSVSCDNVYSVNWSRSSLTWYPFPKGSPWSLASVSLSPCANRRLSQDSYQVVLLGQREASPVSFYISAHRECESLWSITSLSTEQKDF